MRKFSLKGKVAQKLKGLETVAPENPTTDAGAEASQAQPETAVTEHGEIRYTWRTDVGRIRKNNHDTVILGKVLFGVADGMGGHNGGEIASAGLRDGLLRETEGQEPSMEIGQVGDSRAYLIRDGQLKQVTSDHSMVADMVRRGVLTEEQAACHPMRNYITRAVGTDDTLDVDMITIPRMNGDRWIICSDGLYGQISKQELEETTKIADLEDAADKLLELALEHGGRDNITLILMQDESTAEEHETAGNTEKEPAEDVAPEDADQEGVTEG